MVRLDFLRRIAFTILLACLLGGCQGIALPTQTAAPSEIPIRTPQQNPTVTRQVKTTAPTATLDSATVDVTPTPASQRRPPSGWTMYSNPDFVRGITVTGDTLWAATLGGVAVWDLDTEKAELFTTRDGLVENQGSDIVSCSMPEPRILVAHESGVLSAYDLELEKWLRIPITFPNGSTLESVQTLLCDEPNNRLLVGSRQGLAIYDFRTSRWSLLGPQQGLPEGEIRAIDVIGQTIWLAGGERGAFMIMGNTIFPFNGTSGFPSGSVNDLATSPDRSIWLGYPTGLVHYLERRWNAFGGRTRAGLRLSSVDHVEMGQDGVIWIASEEEGACPFDPVTYFCSTVYRAPNDIPMTDLFVDSSGLAYVATNGAGVLVLDQERRELSFHNQQLLNNEILDVGSQGEKLWVATGQGMNVFDVTNADDAWDTLDLSDSGLAIRRARLLPLVEGVWFFDQEQPQAVFWDGEDWLRLGISDGLDAPVIASVVDQRGYAWMATAQSLFVWDGSLLRPQPLRGSEPGNTYYTLFEQNGVMWLGSEQGLLRRENFQWTTELPELAVYAMLESDDGDLLLGTEHGLIRYQDGQSYQWVINLGDEVVIDPVVTALAYDGDGDLWVGTQEQGLYHFTGQRWERVDITVGLPSERIVEITTDNFGGVWIVAAAGHGGGGLLHYMP